MPAKIAVIGSGFVGTTVAYTCIMRNICAEILLVDINEDKCHGEVMDLSDTLSFSEASKVKQATFKEAAQADIIVIAAGKQQAKGEPRTVLLQANRVIVKQVLDQLQPLNPQAIIIMISNPVDVMTNYAQKITKLPRQQIMGSGTLLDSQRLRNLISQKMHIGEESIHVYIIGEHGDSQFALLSTGRIAGIPLTDFFELRELEKMAELAKQKGYEIIAYKGFTNFGVASCVTAMCENIIFDQNRVMPVSWYIPEHDICMCIPVAVGSLGVTKTFLPPLDDRERELFAVSVGKLKELNAELRQFLPV